MSIPKNTGLPFTEQDDATIRAMHAKRNSVAVIAAALERSEGGVKARLERLGLRASRVVAKQSAFLGA